MPFEGSWLACACIEHDPDRHVVCAQTGRYAQAGYAQRAVQLMCPAQQLIAIRLEARERRSASAMPSLTPISSMHKLAARPVHGIASMYIIAHSMA